MPGDAGTVGRADSTASAPGALQQPGPRRWRHGVAAATPWHPRRRDGRRAMKAPSRRLSHLRLVRKLPSTTLRARRQRGWCASRVETPAGRGGDRPGGRRALSGLGPAGRRGWTSSWPTGRSSLTPKATAIIPARSRPSARERSTCTSWMGIRRSPTRPPASSPPDPTDPRRSSIRAPSRGPTTRGRESPARARSSTSCTWERSPPPGPGRPRAESSRSSLELGITVVEVMPVADFAGDFGWGYDGVDLFAPTRLYGRPDEFRAFVDRAHAVGLGVILDVVYNHLGPDGNYLGQFASELLQHPSADRLGAGHQLRRTALRPGTGILHRERRVLDRGVPPGRPPARRHSGHLRRLARARPDGRGPTRPREGGPSEGASWSPRTSRRTCGWSGPWPRAATISTPCGTTTFTTPPWSP